MIDDTVTVSNDSVTTESPKSSAAVNGMKAFSKSLSTGCVKLVMLITEIAVVAYLGSLVGAYYNAKSIQSDCASVNLAKAGDAYLTCNIVVPKKDGESATPR